MLLWWLAGGAKLNPAQRKAIDSGSAEEPLWVADIALWEVATLYERGRLELSLPLRDWLELATAPPLVRLMSITPAVASEVASLPATFRRDPADRIHVATTRVLGGVLLTSDQAIIRAKLVATL